jgi:hypothetical protein
VIVASIGILPLFHQLILGKRSAEARTQHQNHYVISVEWEMEETTHIIAAKKHSRLKLDGATRQSSQMSALTSKEKPKDRSEYTGDVETPFPLIISLIMARQIWDIRRGYQLVGPM